MPEEVTDRATILECQALIDRCLDKTLFAVSREFLGGQEWIGVPRAETQAMFSRSSDFQRLCERLPEEKFYFLLLEFDRTTIESVILCDGAEDLRQALEAEQDFHYWVLTTTTLRLLVVYAPPDLHWDIAAPRPLLESIMGCRPEGAAEEYLAFFRSFPAQEFRFHQELVAHYRLS